MADAFTSTAAAEDRSFAQDLRDLVSEFGAPVYDPETGAWRFPVPEGDETK